jgi:hypothetical protein
MNIFPTNDISDNGSSVWASTVVKLYHQLYNWIMQIDSQLPGNKDIQQL